MDEKKNHPNESMDAAQAAHSGAPGQAPDASDDARPVSADAALHQAEPDGGIDAADAPAADSGEQGDAPEQTAPAEPQHLEEQPPGGPAEPEHAPSQDMPAEQADTTQENDAPAVAGDAQESGGSAQPAAAAAEQQTAGMQAPEDQAPKKKRKRLSLGSKIIIGIGAVVVFVAALFMPMLYRIFYDQQSSFASKPVSTPVATDDAYYELLTQADTSMMKDIVNVLLIGVDYAEERETWSGKHQFNSDVMIVLALNFKENKVDMISIPRDTYAKLPNLDGFYKMNSALHYGGGIPDGFANVMQACSWELGGIPIDYYMAVTMPTVKELVDEIGGVDYDVDVEIHMQGRTIKKGFQHMDGQMCLDYFRARKGIDNDLGRINRQKKLLVAIFNKLRDEKGILDLPDLVKKFEGKLYTNMTLEQVAAAAVFGYKLPTESITMRSLPGSLMNIYNWNFVIVNQPKRVEMIEEVYGVTVKQMDEYGQPYCKWQWATMQGEAYIERVQEKLNGAAAGKLAEDQSAHFAELIATLQSAMDAQKNVAKSKKQSDAINAAKDELRSYAEQVLGPLGITINWKVAENPDGPPVLQ